MESLEKWLAKIRQADIRNPVVQLLQVYIIRVKSLGHFIFVVIP